MGGKGGEVNGKEGGVEVEGGGRGWGKGRDGGRARKRSTVRPAHGPPQPQPLAPSSAPLPARARSPPIIEMCGVGLEPSEVSRDFNYFNYFGSPIIESVDPPPFQ